MKANYGYKDGSGDFFITIDTDLCNTCGPCKPVRNGPVKLPCQVAYAPGSIAYPW